MSDPAEAMVEEEEELGEKAEGILMGKLIVTIYENLPAEVEIVDPQPGFSFRHLKFAKRAFLRALAARRREEARKETPIEIQQREEAAKQALVDAENERKKKEEQAEKRPSRNIQRVALEQYKKEQKEGAK